MNELEMIAKKCEFHHDAEPFQVINGAFIPPLLFTQRIFSLGDNVAILTGTGSSYVGIDWLKFNGELILDSNNKPALRAGFFLQTDYDLMSFAEYFGYAPSCFENDIESDDEDEDDMEHEDVVEKDWYDYIDNASYEEIFAACVMLHNEMTFDGVTITSIDWPKKGWY